MKHWLPLFWGLIVAGFLIAAGTVVLFSVIGVM